MHSQEDISKEVVKHFKKAYQRDSNKKIEDILWGIEPFSNMFDEEDNARIYATVTEEESLTVMKSFKKDKWRSPDD